MNIRNNIQNITQTLPERCKLIAVSKAQPNEKIQEAYNAGHRIFGENKVQELTAKYEALPKDIQWHMIGHLQSNKVKYIAPFVTLIHSVDSIKLLEEIDKQARKINRTIDCLLQIHIAQEETKFGFTQQEALDCMQKDLFKMLANIRIVGLMGMATLTEDQHQVRKEFKGLKTFFDYLKLNHTTSHVMMNELSMGMSSDYTIAAEEGSTLIRIGTAIFGERNYL